MYMYKNIFGVCGVCIIFSYAVWIQHNTDEAISRLLRYRDRFDWLIDWLIEWSID
jgi:hypothetical protein